MILVLFYAAPRVIPYLHLKHDPLARPFVWSHLADELAPLIAQHPDALLVTNERKIAAAFTYQLRDTRGSDVPVYKWKPAGLVRDHYDLVTEDAILTDRPLLFVMRQTGARP